MTTDFFTHEILTPSGFIILNLGELSNFIENKYKNYLEEPPLGIYKIGEQIPSLRHNEICFVRNIKDDNYQEPLVNFDLLNVDNYLVNNKGNVIIDNFYIKNKNSMLFNKPTIPTTGYNLVKSIVNFYIANKNIYTKESTNILAGMYKFIKPCDDQLGIINGVISENCFESVYQQLNAFIAKDINHIYFYKSVGICDLIVEKTIDWRAHQWHLEQDIKKNEHNNF